MPILVEDFREYAASERWMILRRRDLAPETQMMLDAPLHPESAERIRAQMLSCYRGAWPFPELEQVMNDLADWVREALGRHAWRVKTALDLGCAAGSLTPLLAPYADGVAGIDLHFERVRAAREDHLHSGLRFLVANAENPPFEDGSIGLALWLNLLDSTGHPRASMDGILRALAPGALVVFASPFAFSSAVSEPSQWVTEAEFDDFANRHFDILETRERLCWVLPSGPRRADVFITKAAAMRKRDAI